MSHAALSQERLEKNSAVGIAIVLFRTPSAEKIIHSPQRTLARLNVFSHQRISALETKGIQIFGGSS
jgi:hypothetical protein